MDQSVSDAQERLSVTHDPVSGNQERVSVTLEPVSVILSAFGLRNPPLGLRSAFPATQVPVSVIQERVFLIQNPCLCLRSASL